MFKERKKPYTFLLSATLFCLAFAIFVQLSPVSAQIAPPKDATKVEWQIHDSVTGIYSVKFPDKYKYNLYPFMFNNKDIAFSSEIVSSLENNEEITKDKNIIIKASQTFGTPISLRKAKEILYREGLRYKGAAEAINGYVVSDDDIELEGFPGKNIYISYNVDNQKYGIRIRIFVTDYAKVEQVLTGPSEGMYSFRSDDYFDSLKLRDGRVTITDQNYKLGQGWVDYTSKQNFFSVKLPPLNSVMVPEPPKFKVGHQKDEMNFHINDPIYDERVFYNVAAYKLDEKVNFLSAKSILFAQHIAKYVGAVDPNSLQIDNEEKDGIMYLRTKLVIAPLKQTPYINTIFFEMRYYGDYAIVQEFLCGPRHAEASINSTLFGLLDFHPEKYTPIKPRSTPEE